MGDVISLDFPVLAILVTSSVSSPTTLFFEIRYSFPNLRMLVTNRTYQ